MLLYACTIFMSAFLLFLVQPIIAKQILPWFGGSAAVWTTCLVFFQVALLAGYAYTDFSTRKLKARTQVIVHVVLLLVSLGLLPIVAAASWKPQGTEDPGLRILGLLVATIGLPYLMLATTGPLVQAWFSRSFPQGTVYRLFALSNLASMLSLLCYPFFIETQIPTASQAIWWSVGYGLFALLCGASAIMSLRSPRGASAQAVASSTTAGVDAPAPHLRDLCLWLALSAMGSWLLLAITNHITQNIASIPFLWLAPLALYLLTFIVCFESDGWYKRSLILVPLAIGLGACAWALPTDAGLSVKIAIPLYLAGLFLSCMFFHGELAKMRPSPRYLTQFYLMVSLGGALGGIFVGLVAPRVFSSYSELGLGFVVTALLAAYTLREMPVHVWLTSIALAGVCGYFWNIQLDQQSKDARVMKRDFYGTLRTKDQIDSNPDDSCRRLVHGVITHGIQYLSESRRDEVTTYYGPSSGVGIAIQMAKPGDRRVGVIGLGAGTLAAWGRPGDTYRFYEINPQVIEIANSEFTFLKDSRATIETVLGDARLNMERETPQEFDVCVVDAFSSDSIPVHLVTAEAMAVYLRHLKPDGILAFHVSNRFLRVAPVIKKIAEHHGLFSTEVSDAAEGTDCFETDWILVTRDQSLLQHEALAGKGLPVEDMPGLKLWTDDYSSLFQILK